MNFFLYAKYSLVKLQIHTHALCVILCVLTNRCALTQLHTCTVHNHKELLLSTAEKILNAWLYYIFATIAACAAKHFKIACDILLAVALDTRMRRACG